MSQESCRSLSRVENEMQIDVIFRCSLRCSAHIRFLSIFRHGCRERVGFRFLEYDPYLVQPENWVRATALILVPFDRESKKSITKLFWAIPVHHQRNAEENKFPKFHFF